MKFILSFFPTFLLFSFHGYTQNDSIAAIALLKKSNSFDVYGQTDSAFFYWNRTLAISQKTNYKPGLAKANNKLGVIYMFKGDHSKALYYFYKALTEYEKLKDPSGIIVQLENIGTAYSEQGTYSKALEFGFKALKLAESIGDKRNRSINLCNIGIIYSKQGDFAKAKQFISKALDIDRETNDKEGIASNLINLGYIHSQNLYYGEALKYYLEALEISKENDDKISISTGLMNIGATYESLKNYKKAEEYFLQGLEIAEKAGNDAMKTRMEEIISGFYEDIGKNREAFAHYKKFIVLRDSVHNEESTKKSIRAEMNYNFDKKVAATKFENDKVIYKLEAENKLHKQLRSFMIAFIVLVLIVSFLAARAYRNKKKLAEYMSKESNRKEVLLQEVHHRINNNLQIISSLLELQANNSGSEKLQDYLKQSQNRIQSLSVLHELLYQNDSQLNINMKEYLGKVMDYHMEVLETLPARVNVSMNISEVSIPTNIAVPLALILNELVTNSIKYAFADNESGKIDISLLPFKNESNKWLLHVEDTGKGLPVETKMRKDSLGLRLVSIMTKQINGSLTSSSSPGATFEVAFSIAA